MSNSTATTESVSGLNELSTDGGDRRRVDLWALEQQAHSTDMAISRAHDETDSVTRAIYTDDDALDAEAFHYAWSALKDARDELVLLAHLAGYERLDLGAVTFGEATDEEMARFERGRDE